MNISVIERAPRRDAPVSSSGATVSLRGISRSFGTQTVLRGIDLDIQSGLVVAIVGRSGCGKSTLLRLIAGLDQPTAGTVSIDGQTWGQTEGQTRGQAGGSRNTVRLMFQEPRLLPWQRVRANVEVGLSRRMPAADRRRAAEVVLTQVGLAGRGGDWPWVLSGGQKQRVALARALVSHPRLLALDEPLGALDALTRIEMQDLIQQAWRDQGFTAIVVTHDVTEAVALADRILLIEHGRIAMDVAVELPRPRRRGDAHAAAIEGRILDRLLGRSDADR
jgi:sulfonate transport system ATP-binding protein